MVTCMPHEYKKTAKDVALLVCSLYWYIPPVTTPAAVKMCIFFLVCEYYSVPLVLGSFAQVYGHQNVKRLKIIKFKGTENNGIYSI